MTLNHWREGWIGGVERGFWPQVVVAGYDQANQRRWLARSLPAAMATLGWSSWALNEGLHWSAAEEGEVGEAVAVSGRTASGRQSCAGTSGRGWRSTGRETMVKDGIWTESQR